MQMHYSQNAQLQCIYYSLNKKKKNKLIYSISKSHMYKIKIQTLKEKKNPMHFCVTLLVTKCNPYKQLCVYTVLFFGEHFFKTPCSLCGRFRVVTHWHGDIKTGKVKLFKTSGFSNVKHKVHAGISQVQRV